MIRKSIVNKGYIDDTGCAFETSILCKDAKKNKSPNVTNKLDKKRTGSISNCIRRDNEPKPVVSIVKSARKGTAIIPRYTIDRKSEYSALITALYNTPEEPQQPAALNARNIPRNSLVTKIYLSFIQQSPF
jgi:hypothetical protein